jgi:uncharacterized protein (TIGR02145 family)
MKNRLLLFIAFTVISSFGNTQTITIGKQVWSTKNLDVSTFRNGDSIPEAKSNEEWNAYNQAEEAAWCYYENNVSNGIKYGKLYNFYAVADKRGLAPIGFHIPKDKEWFKLFDFLGCKSKESFSLNSKTFFGAGPKLKSKGNENGNGTNSSGFSGILGGYRQGESLYEEIGTFGNLGQYSYFWSSSMSSDTPKEARSICISYEGSDVFWYNYGKSKGHSVRCIKD